MLAPGMEDRRRQLRSATSRTCVDETNIQQPRRQVFCSCRSEAVEQPSN